jgi:catechol 2,3-dioxygenase-like lactoylglutathione lyase family enzyme
MIDHLGVPVSNFAKSKTFYARALAPLGYEVLMEFPDNGGAAGLGVKPKPDLWIGAVNGAIHPIHIAIRAADRASVDAFHKAALAAGGRDNGGPGLRPHYHKDYYGAFVLDPDGHNVEAVCHDPPR